VHLKGLKGGETESHRRILLNCTHHELSGIGVQLTSEGLEILRAQNDGIRLLARDAQPTELRIFLDTGSVEVCFRFSLGCLTAPSHASIHPSFIHSLTD